MTDSISFDDEQESSTENHGADFFSGGAPSCKFNAVGDTHKGTIVTFETAQQRDIVTGAPKFWPDGNKCEMLVVTLQTDERDGEIDDDDGQRRLYINKPSGMFAAIKAALGKNRFAVGGQLAIRYTGNGKPKQAAFSPPKEYTAKYLAPNSQHEPAAPANPTSNKAETSIKFVETNKTKNGQEFYKVIGSNGMTFYTFSRTHADTAKTHESDGIICTIEYIVNERGSNSIVGIVGRSTGNVPVLAGGLPDDGENIPFSSGWRDI